MTKRRVTKIDPKEKLSRYLAHQTSQSKKQSTKHKASDSLAKLRNERRSAIVKRLGSIIIISLVMIIILGYYISPLAIIKQVKIQGVADLPANEIVQTSGIKAGDKVVNCLFNQKQLSNNLMDKYTEIQRVEVKADKLNRLTLAITEHPPIGYIKTGNKYRKILAHGKLGTKLLPWNKVNQDKPIFVGYNKQFSLKKDLQLFNSLPDEFRSQVKLLSGNTRRKSQVIFLMKDGNVVVGNIATLKDKIHYYNKIKTKTVKNSLIDLEVGAFTRPLTVKEKQNYGLT
ncbi:FtsQ-type POTRA domain-containing protein [Lactobacillus sp. ESL0684]|uniref:cell division protein FtsQ/DivIB n=1 Tax=unclassified Lactobacillus TaxID=2620435 RepID=UPI0023FA25DE|nr:MULTISPECIES: FtsQ-type POTRA domain-containing protein [unclassified Lactobacillus]WEV40586.1 FtsQ-type POTRA domain-containing protein [Lactobacillus sp. ESL0681]WEV42893.1 FtsQ-type POTRA domain-containing protein [Lactobacillus sp. ESL0684]